MKQQTPFRLLLRMFQDRFFENDTVSPGSGFETNIYQVSGFLMAVGFFVAYFGMPAFMELSFQKIHNATIDWALRNFRLFLPAFTFAVIGFATVFEWDTLFPDRRDFLIVSLFPIPLREIFAAKFGALGFFLAILLAGLNALPTFAAVVFCLFKAGAWGFGIRLVTAQVAASAGAGAMAFLLVAAFQGVVINLTTPGFFRRISPWIQTAGMSLAVLAIFLFPIYLLLLKPAAEAREAWLWCFPPVWFTGFYDLLLPERADPLFVSLGYHAIRMLLIVLLFLCLTWTLGFHRHVRRTLEADDTFTRRPARARLRFLAGSPQEWALFAFCRKTLARSIKHRLFLATWLSVGIAVSVLVISGVRQGRLEWSTDGMRPVPFLIAFFVISGFRTVFQFPADLACNWALQMSESRWSEIARRVARKTVFVSGLIPVLLVMAPLEIRIAGLGAGVMHLAFQFAVGALLIELMFWRFEKAPFTCSYFAGRVNLSLLAGLYFYGMTMYSFNLEELETALEHRAFPAIAFFAAASAALATFWHRDPEPSEVIFDASEPFIQTLDLN